MPIEITPEDQAEGRHRRNLQYDHPSSKARRAYDRQAQQPAETDPIARLRLQHHEQKTAMRGQHEGEVRALWLKHQNARNSHPQVMNGLPPPRDMLEHEKAERLHLAQRHSTEKEKAEAKYKREMALALDRHNRRAQ